MVHRKSGQIVFVNSVAGKVPIPYRSSFAASKHAIQAFADSLRAEIAMHQVKVLVCNPEYIASDLSNNDIAKAGTMDEGISFPSSRFTYPFERRSISTHFVRSVTEKASHPLGEPPQQIAESLFQATLREIKEEMPVSFRFAHWLRVICPAFFHFMMARRAEQASTTAEPVRY